MLYHANYMPKLTHASQIASTAYVVSNTGRHNVVYKNGEKYVDYLEHYRSLNFAGICPFFIDRYQKPHKQDCLRLLNNITCFDVHRNSQKRGFHFMLKCFFAW